MEHAISAAALARDDIHSDGSRNDGVDRKCTEDERREMYLLMGIEWDSDVDAYSESESDAPVKESERNHNGWWGSESEEGSDYEDEDDEKVEDNFDTWSQSGTPEEPA